METREPRHYRASLSPERNACGKGLRWTATNDKASVTCEACLARISRKPSLEEAAGQFLHANIGAPFSPYEVQRYSIKYQDVEQMAFENGTVWLKVSPEPQEQSCAYSIASDGKLECVGFRFDSSD